MSLADEVAAHGLRAFKARPELLLQNNTVKAMHGCVPRIILGAEWWEATRRAALASTGNRCAACGVRKAHLSKDHPWLECHEVYRTNYRRGRQTYVETVPLCHDCHSFIHCGRLKALRDRGEVTGAEFERVMRHGSKVLRDAGLKKRHRDHPKIAAWEQWRLVIDGKEYPPVYSNYEEWAKVFGGKREIGQDD